MDKYEIQRPPPLPLIEANKIILNKFPLLSIFLQPNTTLK